MITRREQLVTVFGGGGFIGRYVCEQLLKAGVRIRVACRSPRTAHFIQPLGQVGQVGFVRADITHARSVAFAVEGASAVVNLVGAFTSMKAVHVDGPRNVAEASAKAGVETLVHLSAIGADPDSPSYYGQTKGNGERAVRAAFPAATIIRPSLVFGAEDNLTNRFAGLGQFPIVPVIAPQRRFQPIYVRDLAQATAAATLGPARHVGKTYELGGPQVLTMRQLFEEIFALSGSKADLVDLPDFAGDLLSRFGFLPGAPLTRDQWLMLQRDNVVGPDLSGLAAFGITPTPLASVAGEWLARFGGSRFGRRQTNLAAG